MFLQQMGCVSERKKRDFSAAVLVVAHGYDSLDRLDVACIIDWSNMVAREVGNQSWSSCFPSSHRDGTCKTALPNVFETSSLVVTVEATRQPCSVTGPERCTPHHAAEQITYLVRP